MSRPLAGTTLLSGALGALGVVAACAATGAQDTAQEPPVDPGDGGSMVLGDAEAHPRDAADEGFGDPPVCTPSGWCRTELPASDLDLTDVWPVGARAFAAAGQRFLEWDVAGGWKFIDKKMGFPKLAGAVNVWAPDEDEVFFVLQHNSGLVGGRVRGAIAIVVRGTRPSPPETMWSWTRSQIDCQEDGTALRAKPALWGASRDEVYTAICGNVYRLNRNALVGDGGVNGEDAGGDGGITAFDRWELEYSDGDPNHSWQAVTGTGTGDVWFVGARAIGPDQCVVLIRKTSEGYSTVVDGAPTAGEVCVAKPGIAMIPGRLRQVDAPAKDRLVGVRTLRLGSTSSVDDDMVQVAAVGSEVQIKSASAASTTHGLTSVWGTSLDDLWVLAERWPSGAGSILRATSVWDGAGKFEFSTLAINGAPNLERLFRIRGTSNQNLWAVGRDRAYFKSTP